MKPLWFILALALAGCASSYTPPASLAASNIGYSRTYNLSFDEAWTRLVDHVSESFFSIDNVEKNSGLLTLDFSAQYAGDYIDCGTIKAKSLLLNFEGPYTDYMENYYNGKLSGKVNLLVTAIDEHQTRIRVSVRYVFHGGSFETGYNTWSFDTGGYETLRVSNPAYGTEPQRTCKPTHQLENSILSVVDF